MKEENEKIHIIYVFIFTFIFLFSREIIMNQRDVSMSWEPDALHEECGVFGMYDFDGNDVASSIYYGLFALQHRGQESCGIAVSDTSGPRKVDLYKGMGLVNEVFDQEKIQSLKGNIGVGHVRYSTAGDSVISNAQPLVINYVKGTLMMAHNGNLINANELRDELAYTGAIFQTTIDSEVIAYLVARERIKSKTAEEAVVNAMKKLKGAYALVVSSPRKLIGARDPYGFKPLCIGKRDNAYILASESCALDTIDAEFVRDVEPGEVVTIDENGIKSDKSLCVKPEDQARCIFEYIYFARPDSYFDGVSVYDSRIMAGKFLAMDSPVDADIVVGVPESGNVAAMGYAMQAGIPYGTAFVKNSYVGRTFIKPQQKSRESSVRVKLNVLKEVRRLARNNNELVAVYGNFVNRALQLTKKYFDGVVPAAGELTDYDRETLKEFSDVKAEVEKLLDVFKFRDAQKEAMNLARIGNKYLADTEPWKIAKTDMDRVATILNISLQLVANLAIAFEPFLPFSSEKLRNMLNMDSFDWATLGSTDLLPAGHQLATPELLFEKIEDSVIEAQVQKLLDTKKANEEASYKANPIRPNIEFDDFMKLDIRVGTVLECQKVPKADKLLQFKIADGLENRTIVSGIAQHYNPEELVGKQVCFVANLAPRKLKGIVSEGMILSAENFDGSLSVVTTMKEVKPGSEVK